MNAPAAARAGPHLTFTVEEAAPLVPSAVPTLRFGLRIEDSSGVQIRSLALTTQLRIAATRRRYDKQDEERLVELFGRPEQWARSLQSVHWTNVPLQVGGFTGSTTADVEVPCTYDLEVSATRYFNGLEDGEVPLEFLFSGAVFYAGESGALQVAPIAWDRDADFRLPVSVWRETMDRHFPGAAWLRLDKDSFDRLHAYRGRKTLLTWENAIDSLLREAGAEESRDSPPPPAANGSVSAPHLSGDGGAKDSASVPHLSSDGGAKDSASVPHLSGEPE